MPNYYLHRDGQNFGPYSLEQMRQMIASRQIAPGEYICQEGGSDWVVASTLTAAPAPKTVARPPAAAVRSAAAQTSMVSEDDVRRAYQKVKNAFLGVVFSAGLPLIFWAAKSDAERGVRSTSGRYRGLQELVRNNVQLLPVAIVIGSIGFIICAIWLAKTYKTAKALKAEFKRQQGG